LSGRDMARTPSEKCNVAENPPGMHPAIAVKASRWQAACVVRDLF
jgi:hypothetical protein